MNSMQKSYSSFIESVGKQFDCTGAIHPLQEGFAALCEASGRNPLTSERLVEFHELVMETVKPIMERINRFLNPCGLSIVLDYSDESREHFGDEPNHVAAIMHSLQDETSVAPVAINEPMIAEYYYGAWDEDDNILEHCLSDTLWHEAGHHVVDTAVDILLNGESQDDEDIVESFGRYMTEKTLGYDSDYDTEMVNKAIGAVTLLKILNSGTYSKESLKKVMAFIGNELTEQELAERLQECGVQEKTGIAMEGKSNSLCESDTGDTRNGSAWDTVERIHVYHAADPNMDMDIKLDSLWATRQKDSVTREDVIDRFVEDAGDFNKWLATSEDSGAFITSALIKFKGEPDAITVDIPCPAGADDLVSCNGQLRQPTTDELYKFIMKATKEEHQLRGDWDSNHEEIGADSDRFIQEIQAGEVQSLTDGRGLVAYGLDNGKMFIYDLYVLPEYRNAGVGGTLLDKVIEIAGGIPVALTVNSMNAPAIQLYRNHGFREVGTVSDNGVELLRMERKPVPEVDADVEQRPAR